MIPLGKNQTVSVEGPCRRLVLGTAQLGMEYGIANKSGPPDREMTKTILKDALEAGICEFDTAQAYGRSEEVLGQALSSLGASDVVQIITKPRADIDLLSKGAMKKSLEASLKNLGVCRVHGFMLHRERLLDEWEGGLRRHMQALVEEGLVDRIGISVYSPAKALQALEIDEIQILQVPSNVLDRRFEDAGIFEKASLRGKQVYVRSIFLQGILLMAPKEISPRMTFAVPTIESLKQFADSIGLTRHRLALGYVREAYPDAKIIIGTETRIQLQDAVEGWKFPLPNGTVERVRAFFNVDDARLLNPNLW